MEDKTRSMTAFSEVSLSTTKYDYICQIKSLNSRFLDLKNIIPLEVDFLDPDIRKICKDKVRRGKITFYLRFEKKQNNKQTLSESAQVKTAIKDLKKIEKNYGLRFDTVSDVLTYLDHHTEKTRTSINKEEQTKVKNLIKAAIAKLDQQKLKEGRALEKEIKTLLKNIELDANKISKRRLKILPQLKNKINKKLKDIYKQDLEASRLHQEVVVLVDKSDIHEELVRLKEHIKNFKGLFQRGMGKKMDFYTQELLRETNTIGSKAQDAQISANVVNMKCNIERIREIVQNIE